MRQITKLKHCLAARRLPSCVGMLAHCARIRLVVADEAAPPSTESSAPGAPPPAATRPQTDDSADEEVPAAHRLREGTHLNDRLGHFRQNGESITFVDEDGRELGGLPNLNLERITRMLKSVDEPESVSWSVSGAVTEFAGRNYLLISRAVYKAATLPPAPDAIE